MTGPHAERLSRWLCVCAVTLTACAVNCSAQDAPAAAPATKAVDVDTLKAKLAALEAEVNAEKAAVAEAEDLAAREMQALQQRRSKLADEAVTLQTEVLTLQRQRGELADEIRTADPSLAELTKADQAMRAAGSALAERLRIYLREVPAHDETRATLTKLLDACGGDRAPEADAALGRVATIGAEVIDEASTLRARDTQVWIADGTKQPVTLLTAGHVAFAYRTGDGRIGLALNSPADASGYRWTETLSPEQASLVASAIDATLAHAAGVMTPMDVSGQLRPDSVRSKQSMREWFESGGPIMYALAGVAALAVLLILERALVLYLANGTNRGLVMRVMRAARERRIEDAVSASRAGRGAVARTLAACLQRHDRDLHAMEDSVQEQLLHEMPRLERFLGGIAILAAVAPLLGLLGTVTGIIQTFGVIRAFGNANPGAMAGGISEALVTTAAGLMIAIPILLLHGVLRGRVDRIIADAEKHAATLLNVVAHDRASDEPTDGLDTDTEVS
ncbi:MAG: DUF3450 family protein [Phycisphaera sp.]|nr:DUF3450 family protein [Phycisphaera sp.]